jgi:hypothetical protein
MSAIRLSREKWPIVIWVFDGEQTDADLDFYFKMLDEIHARRQRFATISWMKKFNSNRKHLARIGAWAKENNELTSTYNTAAAMISTSPLFRFVLSSFFLIQPMRTPYQVCASYQEATDWISERLRAGGLPVPSGLAAVDLAAIK